MLVNLLCDNCFGINIACCVGGGDGPSLALWKGFNLGYLNHTRYSLLSFHSLYFLSFLGYNN